MSLSGEFREIPPPLELECLRALWRMGDGSVKDVREALGERRPLAYTTIMTVLDRLARRGAVERQKQNRAYRYHPLLSEQQVRQMAVQELLNTLFSGSVEELRGYLQSFEPAVPAEEQAATPAAMAHGAGL